MPEPIATDLWQSHHDLFLPGRVHFPCRMTTIRLRDGSLALHSPIPIDDSLAAKIQRLGEVKYLLAPNTFHHLFLKDCRQRYPQAKLYAAAGLSRKRADPPMDGTLGEETPAVLREELDQLLIAGAAKVNEMVFLHKASASLIVTDLVFNIRQPRGWLTALILRAMGASAKTAQSRAWRFFVKDRKAFLASLEKLFSWEFDRLIMAHGDIVESNAKQVLREALALRGHIPPKESRSSA